MKRILVCDDDEGISEVIKIILTQSNYDVNIISNGHGILKIVDKYQPDVILLDIWMPGLSGKEIIPLLKKDQRFSHVPIIIISALNEKKEVFKKYGADDFLAKPFDMKELLMIVKKYVN